MPNHVTKDAKPKLYTKDIAPIMRKPVLGTSPPNKHIKIQPNKEIKTKLEAIVFDESDKEIMRTSAAEVFDNLEKIEKGHVLVIDGVMTQRLLERSKEKGITTVIGARKGEITKKPTSVKIIEFKNV